MAWRRGRRDATDSPTVRRAEHRRLQAGRAIGNVAASWAKAKAPTRATMIQSVYEEIVVRG
jgi:hypothetical protein